MVLDALSEAFSSFSFEEVVSAYMMAEGDANKAAELLGGFGDNKEDQFECSSSSESSSSGCVSYFPEGIDESEFVDSGIGAKGVRGRKAKRVVAAAGTISTVLGKDYVMCRRRGDRWKQERNRNEALNKGDMEQFLCSMLGSESELSMAVVRDVLGHCEYDVGKALDSLLKLCAPSNELSKNGSCCNDIAANKEDAKLLTEYDPLQFLGGESDLSSHSSESDSQDNLQSMACGYRSYSEVFDGSEAMPLTNPGNGKSDLPQEMLESLFNITGFSECESRPLNWRDILKKVESLGYRVDFSSPVTAGSWQKAKGDEYHVLRKDASQHWDSMKTCYKRAAMAYSNGNRQSAGYLSEQGKLHRKKAREADERASRDIFKARNERMQNVVTIDLHGQNVKEAVRLLKVHLVFGRYVQSIQLLRVITGCGAHGVGKSKVREAVMEVVEREGMQWRCEGNPGTVLIVVEGQRELSFMDSP